MGKALAGTMAVALGGNIPIIGKETAIKAHVMTVQGKIKPKKMGKTLIHEHILVDFIGASETGYHRWEKDKVIEKMTPYLLEIKEQGYSTLVDCTPAFLGRDPVLLKTLSENTGINIITNTGLYGAYDNKYLPDFAFHETAEQLADRWTGEVENGIEGTGVYPGFIKMSVNQAALSDLHKKLIRAAGLTHLRTGLTIASHTGTAVPALEQLEILESMGVKGSAFVWVHAQNENDHEMYRQAAAKGAWISIEGIRQESMLERIEKIVWLKEAGLLSNTLVSHDGGWYDPEKPGGGTINGFTLIADEVVPELQKRGFSDNEVDTLFKENPAKVFSIEG